MITGKVPQSSLASLYLDMSLKQDVSWKKDAWSDTQNAEKQLHFLVVTLEDLFCQQLGLPQRIFWSNTALYLSLPWKHVGQYTHDYSTLSDLHQRWMMSVHPKLTHQIQWMLLEDDRQQIQLQIKRQDCCLKYQSAKAKHCSTCPFGVHQSEPTLP